MDDVLGLADRSTEFSSFLTVSKKFGYICFYVFRIVFPNKSTWHMILSQTKIFNIFPSVIQLGNMLKILTNKCDRETINYIPSNNFWTGYIFQSQMSKKTLFLQSTAEMQPQQSIGQMQTMTLSSFVAMGRKR